MPDFPIPLPRKYNVTQPQFKAWVKAQPDDKEWPYYDDDKCPLAEFLGHRIDFNAAPAWCQVAISRACVRDKRRWSEYVSIVTKASLLEALE